MKTKIGADHNNRKPEDILYPPKGWGNPAVDALTREELIRSNKELEQFAFLAAHDLQEPLKVANSYAQLLNRKYRGKLDDKADKLIFSILEHTERMQELVQSMLRYSQVGKGHIEFKELDCRVIFNRAIENLIVNIEENSAQIRYENCPLIRGNEIQLTQLFQNLINNAIKFRKKDEPPRIRISVQEKEDQWFFSIQDNGIGVEPEYTQQIFELFKKLHSQNEYAGSGIGLALCKRIVEMHHGKIWVESQMGEGTTVCFTIPRTDKL